MQPTEKAALLSSTVSTGMLIFQVAVGLATNSMGVIADGIHTSMDVVAALLTFAAVRHANRPPDEDHRYGHGQYEALAAVLQSLLILLVSSIIIYEAVQRAKTGVFITDAIPGIVVTVVAIIAQGGVVLYLLRTAREHESLALRANALHLGADVITSLGVLASLVLVKATGFYLLDSLAAIVVALIIIKNGFDVGRDGLAQLLDKSLPPDEMEKIRTTISTSNYPILDVHSLRARRSGNHYHIDAHLEVPEKMQIGEAYDLVRDTKERLYRCFPKSTVVLQVEPSRRDNRGEQAVLIDPYENGRWNELTLSNLSPGYRAMVRSLTADGLTRRRLLDLGLVPGTVVEAIRKSPTGDPIAYRIRGAVIALRSEEGTRVNIQPV